MCQVKSQLNIKEVDQLKCQRNYQVPSQGPHQLIYQIESSRDPKVFPRDMTSIMLASLGFGESSGDPRVSPSDNLTKNTSPVPIIKPNNGTSETQPKILHI